VAKSREGLLALVGSGTSLEGKRFLDIGAGSGLSSLAARQLGAKVLSFDYDADSVAASSALKERFRPADADWTVERGSILDDDYVRRLGQWDVVYSWGVLHHTGSMWQALERFVALVAPGGTAVLAIYNDQGPASRRWTSIKRMYSRNAWSRPFLLAYGLARIWGWQTLMDFKRLTPFATWRNYSRERGMSAWHDLVDWVGGYPFEVARPEEIFDFFKVRGFRLTMLITRQGRGCNEFCFTRDAELPRDAAAAAVRGETLRSR
jgi:2-polyprenyl-6-hydroxyphenyl methylase/3-demethylubiquinone-9 3-methyltransferase